MKRPELARPQLAAGGVLIAGVAIFVLVRIGSAAPEAPVPPPPAPPAPLLLPAAAPPVPAPAPASAEGLRLFGLLGRGAVIADASGRQLFYGIGREVRPGLRLERVEQSHVVLASTGGEVRLGFDGPAEARPAAAAPTPADGSDAALREETLRYRLGLAPRRVADRTDGFIVRPGVEMPSLARAGLRPGDVILGVNGSGFDEERMLELAWQIAHSDRTEFEVERRGRRIRLAVQGQQP